MPGNYSSIDKIRAELAWVNETPDPNKCGCRNVRCCEKTGHKPGACSGPVATKFWTVSECTTVRNAVSTCGVDQKRGVTRECFQEIGDFDGVEADLFSPKRNEERADLHEAGQCG